MQRGSRNLKAPWRTRQRSVEAWLVQTGLIVGSLGCAGARVRGHWASKSSYESGYKQRLEQLIDAGRVVDRGGHWETTDDLIFASPSAAAAVCFGRSSNGREAWIHEASGLSYNAFQAQQLAPTDPETSPSDQ